MFRNLLILIGATWGSLSFALPSTVTLHQSLLFPKIESSFSNWCRLMSASRSSGCFVRSLMTPSSELLAAPILEKVLKRELFGNLHLNRGGLKREGLKHALRELLNKKASVNSPETTQAARLEVLKSLHEGAVPWVDGVLWSPLENGNLLVLQKSESQHGITEILVIFSGNQVETL